MTPRRRPGISPGPSWAILSEPATSSPSTRTSIRSDSDSDLDVDMGDDESEHEPEHAPISKRKAPTDELGSARKPHKLPRLDPNGSTSTHRVTSSSSASGSGSPSKSRATGHASHTQPTQKISKKPISPERPRTSRDESTSSGTSTASDFPKTLSQRVQKANARDKETTQTQGSLTTRRAPPVTARKQTAQGKNVRKVTTANLLKNAQKPGDPMDESRAWTRVRPKGKQKRTNFDEEMGRSRPLAIARERVGDTIELTDSSDSTRRRRLSQPSTTNGPRPSVLLNKDGPIVITSDSEDDRLSATCSTQWRRSGPSGTQGKGATRKGVPPVDVEVISILDSDEDMGTSGATSRPPEPSAAQASTSRPNPPPPPSQRSPAAPPPAPIPVTAPTPITPASTSTQLPEHPPSRLQDTQRQDSELPSSPSCGPPPDDFDDAFGNMDFDTTGDDVNPSDALDGWDNFVVGPLLTTVQTSVSSQPVAGGGSSTNVPESAEDEPGPDALFDSYVNMDQLEGDVDHGTSDVALQEHGDEAEERAAENGVTNGLETSAFEQPLASRSESGPNLDGDKSEDVHIRDLEEGEVDPNDAPSMPMRFPETPESGEIRSRVASQLPSQPDVARLAQTSTLARLPSSTPASPRSSASAKSTSQPLERTSTLAMPDISLYKGVRFRRPFPGARENSFFSRALNGAARSGKANESAGEGSEPREGGGSPSGGVSTPVEVLSGVGEVQDLDVDADMQDDSPVSMPGPSKASDKAVAPTPPPVPQQPEGDSLVSDVQSKLSTIQVQPPTVRPSVTANDWSVPASTQPTTSSTQVTPSLPPPATQPMVRPASSPFIAPPRVPRPNTPRSLVEVLNELRREKLQELKEGRELVRKQSTADLTDAAAESATPLKSASQGPQETPVPPPPQLTPVPSSSQPTRTFGRTPGLNDLRTLLVNELRREKPQELKEGRELVRKQSAVDLTDAAAEPTTHLKSASQGPQETSIPPPPQLTPVPSSSQPTRTFGRMPSLNNLRTLLARRNPEPSPARPIPAATPTRAWNDDGDSLASFEPVPAPEAAQMPTLADEDGDVLAVLAEPVPAPAPEVTHMPTSADEDSDALVDEDSDELADEDSDVLAEPIPAPEATQLPTLADEDGDVLAEPVPAPEAPQMLADEDSDVLAEPLAIPAPSAPAMTEVPAPNSQAPAEPVTMPAPAPELSATDSHAQLEPIALPAPATPRVPTSADAKDGPPSSSSESARLNKSIASTPTPTTVSTSESSGSSSAYARRHRAVPLVPFEAFISPAPRKGDHERGKKIDKGKGKEVAHAADPFGSPAVTRPRVSMGTSGSAGAWLLGSQRPKGRTSWHARRESASASASAAFEAYIVRDVSKQTSEAHTGTGTGTGTSIGTGADTGSGMEDANDAQPVKSLPLPQSPKLPITGPELASVKSPVVPDVTPAVVPVPVPESDIGEDENGQDGSAEDMNVMEVDVDAEDVCINLTSVDAGMAVGKGEGEGETQGEGEVDETDMLLELASVHLSQPERTAEEEVTEVQPRVDEADEVDEMDVMDESADPLEKGGSEVRMVDEPERDVGNAMAVDSPPRDLEMEGDDEGGTISQTVPDGASSIPDHREANSPELPADDIVTPVSEDNVASTSRIAPENGIVQDEVIRTPSCVTTPDLVLPEDDDASVVEIFSREADQNGFYDASHTRHRSGADSVAECDALLTAPTGYDSEFEDVTIGSLLRGKDSSSTLLKPPRVRSRSPRSSSPESRTASSVDSDVVRHRSASVSGQIQDGSSSRSGSEYLCGHRIITWASYVSEQRERPPEYKLSRNLPHSLQDHMNTLPASFRNSDIARRIFEAHIQEAMLNELRAPAIEIFDNNIGDEMTPRWEFHYTNEMWYGEGVPPPDIKRLESCKCVGKCDPKSGKCACARRQLKWVQRYIDADIIPSTWPGSPFVYDSKGVLQRLECPIFECNRFCDCDDDCPNRVVQNGRKWPVHIVRTEHKGWGVSAGNKKIPKGSYLGIYAGELLTEQEAEERGRYYDLYGRTYLFSIDFHHLKFDAENPEECENLYVVDAYHAGNFSRFLNHSCDPNCKIFACYIDDADVDKPLLAVFTTRDVEPWEELCFSYYGDIDEKREEIEKARERGEELVRAHAVYAQCRCEASNCIGRLFS